MPGKTFAPDLFRDISNEEVEHLLEFLNEAGYSGDFESMDHWRQKEIVNAAREDLRSKKLDWQRIRESAGVEPLPIRPERLPKLTGGWGSRPPNPRYDTEPLFTGKVPPEGARADPLFVDGFQQPSPRQGYFKRKAEFEKENITPLRKPSFKRRQEKEYAEIKKRDDASRSAEMASRRASIAQHKVEQEAREVLKDKARAKRDTAWAADKQKDSNFWKEYRAMLKKAKRLDPSSRRRNA